jgi:hypothetical protein
MAVRTAHIPMPELLHRLQTTLIISQKKLAELVGKSPRTIICYYQRGGFFLPQTHAALARACQPRDPSSPRTWRRARG